jgi:hypothetical protein
MKRDFTSTGSKITFLLVPFFLLVAGCHKDDVQVYNTPNDQAQQAAAPAVPTNSPDTTLPPGHPNVSSMQNMSLPDAALPAASNSSALTWTAPTGWTEVPPSQMRVASFKVSSANGQQADVSIVPLSGSGGGDPANVNRWRGQVGLPDAPDDTILSSAQNVEAGDAPAQLYDINGKDPDNGKPMRILAVIQHRDSTAWFFKMTGDADLVEQQKPAFVQFLKSISFTANETQAQLPPGHPPVGEMGNIATQPQTTASATQSGQPNWQVPAAWKEISGELFLVAKFTIAGDGGTAAAVNVSASQGDGGGLPANVNRWRGQLGLPPVAEIPTTTFAVPGGQAQLVDMSGTNAENQQPAEIIGIMVTQPNATWFYKLMGDPKLVASQKDTFMQFVKGVKY